MNQIVELVKRWVEARQGLAEIISDHGKGGLHYEIALEELEEVSKELEKTFLLITTGK